MRRTLLGVLILLGTAVLASPPPAVAAGCTTQTYCNFCPTDTGQCCCEAGTPAVGQVTSCNRRLICQYACYGQPPGSCLGGQLVSELGLEVQEASSPLQCSSVPQKVAESIELVPSSVAPR